MQNQGLRGLLNEGDNTALLTLEPGVMRFSQEMENKEYVLADVEIPSQTLFLKESFSFNSQSLPDLSTSTVLASSYYSERDNASGMYYFYTVIRPYHPSYYKGSSSARDYPDCFMPGVMRLNNDGLPYEVCGDWEVRTTGEGKGLLLREGTIESITWKRTSDKHTLEFYAESGQRADLSVGTTYINILDDSNKASWE
jgi:hypothetical protein